MLTDYSVAPQDGQKPEYLVIFFHGSGGNGEDTAQRVGELLGPLMPDAKIRCPDGPVDLGWRMHDWFEIRDLQANGSIDSDEIARRATGAAKDVNEYISRVIAEEGIPEDRVIIAGFSLGATMAFYAALLRDTKVGAVYSLSGGALDRLSKPVSKPPVALVAGGEETGPYSGAWHTEKTFKELKAAGFRTACNIIPGQDHEITKASMQALTDWVRQVMAESKQDNRPARQARRNAGPRL